MNELDTLTISNTARYFEIATQSYSKVQQLSSNCDRELKNSPINQERLLKHAGSVHNEAIITVVFCAMTLEAFVNEYGAKHFSRKFFNNHLDRLSLISKFVIIPRINNNNALATDDQHFQDLKWLINLRNELTHFKTKEINVRDLDMAYPISQKYIITKDHAKKALNTAKNVMSVLDDGKLKVLELHIDSNIE